MPEKNQNYLQQAQNLQILEECNLRDSEGLSYTLANIFSWAEKKMKLGLRPHPSNLLWISK